MVFDIPCGFPWQFSLNQNSFSPGGMEDSTMTGWWYTNPSETYESQLGWWHSQLNGKMKNVPNYQPALGANKKDQIAKMEHDYNGYYYYIWIYIVHMLHIISYITTLHDSIYIYIFIYIYYLQHVHVFHTISI